MSEKVSQDWIIKSVRHAGPCYDTETGAPRAADCFKVELGLAGESFFADVEFTILAGQEIDFQMGAAGKSLPERNRLAYGAVEEFVRLNLRNGWDPRKCGRLVFNGDAVRPVAARLKKTSNHLQS